MFKFTRTFGTTMAVTTAATAIAVASFGSGASAATAQETDTGPSEARIERACLRIPNLTIRTENVIERINGDAETRGSLLWLDGRIARAEEAGRTEMVEVLTNRRAVREATVPVLEERLVKLGELTEKCREAGVDL